MVTRSWIGGDIQEHGIPVMEKHMELSIKKRLSAWVFLNGQLYEVELVKPEIDHKAAINNSFFSPILCKIENARALL